MPQYRYEITRGDTTETHELEWDSIERMREEALQLAVGSIKELRPDFWDRPRWTLRVTDESNMTLLSLSFSADY